MYKHPHFMEKPLANEAHLDLIQWLEIKSPSPLQKIPLQVDNAVVDVWCKRDDALHPVISGNKWRKLEQTIHSCISKGVTHIGSFGGAYSNHLHALAYVAYRLKISFTAFVRAHPNSPDTPTFRDLRQWGAQLIYLNRMDYRKRDEIMYVEALKAQYSLDVMIPEGGSDETSVRSVGSIMRELCQQSPLPFDVIILPVASGGTMAGLIHYITAHKLPTRVIGIAVLKGESYLESKVKDLLSAASVEYSTPHIPKWEIIHHPDIHAGGYAKSSVQQQTFKSDFYLQHQIQLDKVYNTKSFFALHQLLKTSYLDPTQRILILHTGGLQGERT
jgi:1-aminocyclopropane-1-carboxylate deaminase